MAKKSIGEANVKLTVEGAEQVASKLKDVKGELEATTEAGRSGFGKLDDAVGKTGQRIEDSTKGLRKFQGALSGIIGVVGGLGAIFALTFGKAISLIRDAEERSEELRKKIEGVGESANSAASSIFSMFRPEPSDELKIIQVLDQGIQKANESAEQATELAQKQLDTFFQKYIANADLREKKEKEVSESIAEIEAKRIETIADLNLQVQDAQERLKKKQANDSAQIDARNAKAAAADLTPILEANRFAEEQANQQIEDNARRRLSLLDGEEQVREELAITEAALQEQIRQAEENNNSRLVSSLKDRLDLEREIANTRIKGIRDADQAEQARSEADDLTEALRETKRALEAQARSINENTREVRGLRERVFNFTPDIRRVAENTSRRTR